MGLVSNNSRFTNGLFSNNILSSILHTASYPFHHLTSMAAAMATELLCVTAQL